MASIIIRIHLALCFTVQKNKSVHSKRVMISTVCSLYFNHIYTHTYLKQGAALSPFLCNLALEYAIWTVQANQERLKLNVTHQIPVYADINILGESIRTMNKNTETL